MADGFTKLFNSILLSSVWAEDHPTRIVWVTLLALCDMHGNVDASIPGLAHAARVSMSECEAAIAKLEAPDKYSKNPEHEGRRIERTSRGWKVLNHSNYRDRRTFTDASGCYVYYALAGDQVKIGSSKNPWARAADMRVARPEIRIVGVEAGGYELERQRQEEFASDRIEKEWFRLSPALQSHISSLRSDRSATVALPDTEAEVEEDAKAETEKSPTTARVTIDDVLDVLDVSGGPRVSWLKMLYGMTEGMGTRGMKVVSVEVLHEAAQELATAGGDITAHRYKIFVNKVLDRQGRGEGDGPTRRKGYTLAATNLMSKVRALRNPQFPTKLRPDWIQHVDTNEIEVVRAFCDRILSEREQEGTLVAQFARAMEDAGL